MSLSPEQEVSILEATPEQLVKAHQYLYYVVARPVVSDYEYDQYCRKHGIDGNGGSDRADDYSIIERKLAGQLLKQWGSR